MSSKAKVLKEFPSAYFDEMTREIRIYTEGITLGRGLILARSTEQSAWKDAARNIKRR